MRCLNDFKIGKNWGLGWKTFLSLKGRHVTLSILLQLSQLQLLGWILRAQKKLWVIGMSLGNHGLCCIWVSCTISLKPEHATWKGLLISKRPQPETMLFCGNGFVSLLSLSLCLQQSRGRLSWSLAAPVVSLVQVTGPAACYWMCKLKMRVTILSHCIQETGNVSGSVMSRQLKFLVFFSLRWTYASRGLAFAVTWPLRSCCLSFNVAIILCLCHRTCISGN